MPTYEEALTIIATKIKYVYNILFINKLAVATVGKLLFYKRNKTLCEMLLLETD